MQLLYFTYMLTCFFEDNNPARGGLRHVTVNAIITREDGKILLVKRGLAHGKPMLESGKWALVGGFVGRDETLIEAVEREVREETGCEINEVTLFRVKDSPNRPKEDRQNIEFVYTAKLVTQTTVKDEEVKEMKWWDKKSLPPLEEMAFDHGEDLKLLVF